MSVSSMRSHLEWRTSVLDIYSRDNYAHVKLCTDANVKCLDAKLVLTCWFESCCNQAAPGIHYFPLTRSLFTGYHSGLHDGDACTCRTR